MVEDKFCKYCGRVRLVDGCVCSIASLTDAQITREEFLRNSPNVCQQTISKALALTSGDRAKQHGDKRENHQNIANLWNAYLRDDGPLGKRRLTGHDVAVMMCLLKIARLKSGTFNLDNYVDLAGYAGVAAECADGQ